MFEVKYDKNRRPIGIVEPEPQPQEQGAQPEPESVEQPEQQLQESSYQSETPVEPQNNQPEDPKQPEGYQPRNFKELREAKLRLDQENARIQKERDQALQRLKEIESQYSKPQQQSATEEEIGDINLAPDELAEGKHLSAVERKIKKLEQQLHSYQARSSESHIETQIKAQYPDFEKVVSPENIQSLKLVYPELASTLNTSGDLYSKAVSAYTMIKSLGIHQEDVYSSQRDKAVKNLAKPRTLASMSPSSADTPLSRANAFADAPLTDDVKKQIYKDMLAAARRQ